MMVRRVLLLMLGLGLAAAGGCGGGSDVPRRAVSGEVTLDGQPIESGMILFTPLGPGPSAGGEITGGKFVLDESGGPSPGSYRVEIRAYRATGKTEFDPVANQQVELKESIIPPRYNQNSELQVTVAPDGENNFQFPLESKPKS